MSKALDTIYGFALEGVLPNERERLDDVKNQLYKCDMKSIAKIKLLVELIEEEIPTIISSKKASELWD